MGILFGIILILISFFIYGGYTRHRAGEINIHFYYNGTLVKLICLVLLIAGFSLFFV